MRILITGVDGFIGTQLAQLLRGTHQVFGLSRKHTGRKDGVTFLKGSLLNVQAVQLAVRVSRPDQIFHLAAQSNIPLSFQDPAGTMATNVNGSIVLYEAVRTLAPQARVISVGSSAEYGLAAQTSKKVKENFPTQPTSPYAVSKVAQGLLAQLYARAYHLNIIHVRPFAIIGPAKKGDALTDFCQGIVRIERGEAKDLKVGPLSSIRDFVDVRDFVRAVRLVARKGKAGSTYNICSGRGHALTEMIHILTQQSSVPIQVVEDRSKRRPTDDSKIVGDDSLIRRMGFRPKHTFRQTVIDTLDFWRQAL